MTDERRGASDPMHSRTQAPEAEYSLMSPEEIFFLVHRDLVLVEEEFDRNLSDASALVSDVARYLHDGGGKRVRPALVLLASRMVSGEASPPAVRLAAVFVLLSPPPLLSESINH